MGLALPAIIVLDDMDPTMAGGLSNLQELNIQGQLPAYIPAFHARRIQAKHLAVLCLPQVFADDKILRYSSP